MFFAGAEMNGENWMNKKSGRVSEKKKKLLDYFEIRKSIFLLIVTVVVSSGSVWFISDLYGKFRHASRDYVRVIELKGLIAYYDEVLTMSAKMASATGDSSWEKRYRQFEPKLDCAIKEATLEAPENFMKVPIEQTDVANAKLVAMENSAFELVRNGKAKAASKILNGKDYETQKHIYTSGISQFAGSLGDYTEGRFKYLYTLFLAAVVLSVVCISILSYGIIYSLQRYNLIRQKEAGAKIDEQEAFLNNVLQSLQYPFFVFDAKDYTVLVTNSAAREGKLPAGLECSGLPSGKGGRCKGPEHTSVLNQVKEKGNPVIIEHSYCNEDGKIQYVEIHAFPIYDKKGNIKQIIEYVLDITERKEAEAALKNAKERVEHLFKIVPSGICTVDKDRIVTSVNDRWCEMTGYSPEEIIGKSCSIFAVEPCQGKCGLYADDVEKPAIGRDCKVRTKDGRTLMTSKNIDYLRDVDGNVVGGIESFEDITSVKKNDEKQTKLVEELQSVNRELKDFAYIISHDLKAPLRGITTLAEWLVTDYSDRFDDDGREQMKLLSERVGRMQKMIDGVLQYSRVGRVREEKSNVNLNELIPQIIDSIAPPANIKITVDNELPKIFFESTRIVQVFQNLLSNAIKYLDKPEGHIRIGSADEENCLKFYVADNGPGIEERYFEKIFQLFQTVSGNKSSESTGVGLTVVKKIVELYGGKIWVESKVGDGSTFYFTIPKDMVGAQTNERLEANLVG